MFAEFSGTSGNSDMARCGRRVKVVKKLISEVGRDTNLFDKVAARLVEEFAIEDIVLDY